MPVDVPGFAYAAIVAVGGIVGYTKAGKVPCVYILSFALDRRFYFIFPSVG